MLRNDLFEKIIKSSKATNTEFLMFKEKLGICPYEENCYEEEIIKLQYEELIEEIGKVSNEKSTKESTKELIEESHNESENGSDKESGNESNKENKSIEEMFEEIDKESEEESIEDLKEPFSLNNKGTTNWYDKNKFKEILILLAITTLIIKIK